MKSFEALADALQKHRIPLRAHVRMAPYTTFRIGGEAALLVEPTDETQLMESVRLLRESGFPMLLLGRGSNVLLPDEPINAVILRTTELSKTVQIEGTTLYASAGATLSEIAGAAQRAGLGGFEFAYGIPGTLGGALCMNAGAYGGEMRDVVRTVRVYDAEANEIRALDGGEMRFSYRHSRLLSSPHLIALGATLALHRDECDAIETRMRDHMRCRRDKQPLEYPSAGSVFKRPEGYYAGALIEQSGLKGYRIGGAEVSTKHAGFIINIGNATASDVLSLIQHIKDTVERDHGVVLETEIQIPTALWTR